MRSPGLAIKNFSILMGFISALLAFFVLFVLQSDFVLFGPIVAMVVWFPGYIGGHIIYTLDRIEYNTRCMAEKMNTDEK